MLTPEEVKAIKNAKLPDNARKWADTDQTTPLAEVAKARGVVHDDDPYYDECWDDHLYDDEKFKGGRG